MSKSARIRAARHTFIIPFQQTGYKTTAYKTRMLSKAEPATPKDAQTQ